ncbi:hypothetical protein HZB04_01590 [Candidatus Wolfebacteria bacterium]|nr:hypothetical protein [Candidatus Wolfebacteria bacterium]
MSLVEDLLVILTSYSGGYKLMRQKIMMPTYPWPSYYKKIVKTQEEAIKEIKEIKEKTLRRTLYRLKKSGFIKNENAVWKITNKGKEYVKNKLSAKIPHFKHLKVENKQKEIIVIFDIPELYKKSRNWLRGELRELGFIQIQKSVWLGPSPLPKEFIEYLNEINILRYLRFFNAKEQEII